MMLLNDVLHVHVEIQNKVMKNICQHYITAKLYRLSIAIDNRLSIAKSLLTTGCQ